MHPVEAKRREAVYQRWCAEILREARDRNSLAWITARALSDSDVSNDPTLQGMIRGFVAERETDLRFAQRDATPAPSAARRAVSISRPPPTGPQVRTAFERLRHSFDDHVIHFDEPGAAQALGELTELRQRYPKEIHETEIQACRDRLDQMKQRRDAFDRQIETLARKAIDSARSGDHEVAATALRRLSSIHAARPALLPDARFTEIRDEITHGGEEHEHRQAARDLIARERAVAAEIKKLADIIHRFHLIARRVPHDSETYAQAERAFGRAVATIHSHDSEWLAGLILELDTFLDELHDRAGGAAQQVDRFLASVREAHARMRAEIAEVRREYAVERPKPGD